MSTHDDIDNESKARIDERFDELYRFLRDLIDDPTPLERIPDSSTLDFRTVRINHQRIQLTAHRRSECDEQWTARVTSWDSTGGLGLDVFSTEGAQNKLASALTSRHPEDSHLLVQTAETAEAALDALEQMILQRQVQVASA